MTTWTNKTVKRNPQFDVRVYMPAQARDFVRKHCPEARSTFIRDVFRYCALYATGGVYVDDDVEVLEPLLRIEQRAGPGKLLLLQNIHEIGWMPPRVMRRKVWNAFMVARDNGSHALNCAMRGYIRNSLHSCLRKSDDARIIGFYPGQPYAFTWFDIALLRHHAAAPRPGRFSIWQTH